MTDYRSMQAACDRAAAMLESFVDDFLVDYCVRREKLDQTFVNELVKYRTIVQEMPEEWPYWLMSQYAAFRLFQRDGLIHTYLARSVIRRRSKQERAFASYQAEHPWRFAFCSIRGNPSPGFYHMVDVLTNEPLMLQSEVLPEVLQNTGEVQLLLCLLAYNGHCWQSFGPHACFEGVIPSDLLFFAQRIDPGIVFMNQIPVLIEKNPVPFMMLWYGAGYPLTYHKKDVMIMNCSHYHEEQFVPEKCAEKFKVVNKHPFYFLSLKRWGSFPHFAACYYHAQEKRLIVISGTDRGYAKLIAALKDSGYELPSNPQNRVSLTMLFLVEEIFGEKPDLNPYEKAFCEPGSEECPQEFEAMNAFLKQLIEACNAGEQPDVDRLAAEAGLDPEMAHGLIEEIMQNIVKDKRGRR